MNIVRKQMKFKLRLMSLFEFTHIQNKKLDVLEALSAGVHFPWGLRDNWRA